MKKVKKVIMTTDEKINNENCNMTTEPVKTSAFLSVKRDKYEHLKAEGILPLQQHRIIEEEKCIYSSFGKVLKVIER